MKSILSEQAKQEIRQVARYIGKEVAISPLGRIYRSAALEFRSIYTTFAPSKAKT